MNTTINKRQLIKLSLFVAVVFFGWISISHAQILSIQNILWTFVNNVFGFLAGAMGALLNSSINTFIVGFGNLYVGGGATSIGGAVDNSWVAVRDVFNLTFIFGLVYIGFKMILNSDDAGTRRWLVNLIMAALLVNFSLFITKFIVDFSNMLAVAIITGGFASGNISDAFMTAMNITTVFNGNFTANSATVPGGANGGYMYIFGAAIVFLVMAFVFAAGAFLVLIRFIALCFYMVMSPLMFLGWVFPQMSGITSRYWRGFLGRAFFAPAYVLMLYFSLQILSAMGSTPGLGSANYGNAFQAGNPTGVTNTLSILILGAGFLLASVVVASKMGADGAGAAIRMGQNLQRRAQRTVQRGAVATGRFAARNTAGYGAQGVNAASERAQRGARRLDARLSQTKFGRSKMGNVILTNVAGGADKVTEAGKRARVAGSETHAEKTKRYEDRQNIRNTTLTEKERVDNIDQGLAAVQDKRNAKEVRADAQSQVSTNVAKLSDERVLQMARENRETMMSPEVASSLTDAHVTALSKSGIFSKDEIKQLNEARNEGAIGDASQFVQTIEDVNSSAEDLNTALSGLGSTIQKFSNERAANYIGNDTSKDVSEVVATNLTEKHLEHLKENLTTERYKQVVDARNSGFENIANNGSLKNQSGKPIAPMVVPDPTKNAEENAAEAQRVVEEFAEKRRRELLKNPKLAESLPASVYANANMAPLMTPQNLQKKIEKGGLSEQERKDIEKNVQEYMDNSATEREVKAWVNWSDKTTVGSNFGFTNNRGNAAAQNQPAAAPAPVPPPPPPAQPAAPQNPHNQFGDAAEAQRYHDWEAQNNPNNNNQA
tara:strand:- start:6436 stop:8928 length:2493 start_codon:yes stop_codon:yes gene_type:complete